MRLEVMARKCERCGVRDVDADSGPSVRLCELCRKADKNRNYSRDNKDTIIVHVDTEGPGDGTLTCISYGREDGTSATLHTTSGVEALNWLFDNLIGLHNGKAKQVVAAFHFNYDTGILAKFTDTRTLRIVHKSGQHGDLTPLCDIRMCLGECGRIHRSDQKAARDIITNGGENDLLAWDEQSLYAIATTPNRRFYVEKRPNGDRYDGRSTLDIHDHGKAFVGGLEHVIDIWQPQLSDRERAAIHWGKQARKTHFQGATPKQIGDYSEAECVAAARCSRKLIDTLKTELGILIKPNALFGAGSVAAASFKYHGLSTRKDMQTERMALAILCYFGGIIETPMVGILQGPADEVDLNSAYPAHMRYLPCMRAGHGHWVERHKRFTPSMVDETTVGYAQVSWNVRTKSTGPFTVRVKDGRVRQPLYCPKAWVTIPEYLAACKQFDNAITTYKGVFWVQECNCSAPLAWMEEYYIRRQEIKAEMKGVEKGTDAWHWLNCLQEAIKLVINAGYGKFAQQRPEPGKYTNLHYAAMITGATRAKVRIQTWEQEARGGTAVYQHTDSVISINGSPIDGGKTLGAWGLEDKVTLNPFVLQPGLMTSEGNGKKASRGVKQEEFDAAYASWAEVTDLTIHPAQWPLMDIKTTRMISRRMAHARGKPELAGVFEEKVIRAHVNASKRELGAAYQMPGQETAWILPPLEEEPNQACLEDILKWKDELRVLIETGEYDDEW